MEQGEGGREGGREGGSGRNERRPQTLEAPAHARFVAGFDGKPLSKHGKIEPKRTIPHAAFASCLIRITHRKQTQSKA